MLKWGQRSSSDDTLNHTGCGMTKTFIVPENGWYVAKMRPFLFFHLPKYLCLSPPMNGPFGQMRMRGWVWLRSNATKFDTRKDAAHHLRLRNNEFLFEEPTKK